MLHPVPSKTLHNLVLLCRNFLSQIPFEQWNTRDKRRNASMLSISLTKNGFLDIVCPELKFLDLLQDLVSYMEFLKRDTVCISFRPCFIGID